MISLHKSVISCQDGDLDEDFDPDEYDEKMKEVFNEEYYGVDEGDQKPEFPYDEELDNGISSSVLILIKAKPLM